MKIADLEVQLYRQGVRFVHFTPDNRRTREAHDRFQAALGRAGLQAPYDHGRQPYRFMPATLAGASCEHVPVLVLEDWDEMESPAREETLIIPAPEEGNQPMVIKVHSSLS